MSKLRKKIVLLAAGSVCVVAFVYFDLGQYLTLSYLKESQASLHDMYAGNQVGVIAGYTLMYILVTGLSLPGALILTLAGGALFGLVVGTVVVSFASTIGATLACLASRFLLQDWVQGKFGDKLAAINQGIEREGAFYLFTLRLIPVFPFFVINLVMGLTKLPIITFFWVSQLGMLAGTVVFVNAGKELAKIDSLSGILSPSLLISFAILGIFPITVKKTLGWYKEKFRSV
jgi:uncharacterized membrane protein YdjX (TVP38/TMEM64 family)